MSIARRVRQLEGPATGADSDTPELIFIVGIEAVVTEEGGESPASRVKVSASTEKPKSFLAYCLHPQCQAREHASIEGETLEQMQTRLTLEHEGLVA